MPASDDHFDLGITRDGGITHVLDKGLNLREIEGLFDTAGAFVDIVKLGWGTGYVTNNLEKKIALYRHFETPVVCGGTFFEAVYAREPAPLGTGGAARLAAVLAASERLLLLNGDTLFDLNYLDLAMLAGATGAKVAMAHTPADDVARDGSTFEVSAPPEILVPVREALEAAGFRVESAGLAMIPKVTVAISDEATAKQVVRLVEGLEDQDDVQDVYANFDIPESVLEAVVS
jgi:hypothetical protein